MAAISNVDHSRLSTERKSTPTDFDKENTPIGIAMKTSRSGTPLLTASNGRLKGHFKILSDEEIAADQNKSGKNVNIKKAKRRSLAPLQQSVEGSNILAGQGRDSHKIKEIFFNKNDRKISGDSKKNSIFSDKHAVVQEVLVDDENEVFSSKSSPKDSLVEDALLLMKKTEKDDDSYWKSMAEERRLALEEALSENENLYDELDQLKEKNEQMKQEIKDLGCYKMLYLSLTNTDS